MTTPSLGPEQILIVEDDPIIGMMLQGVNFQDLAFKVGAAEIKYGMFIGAVIDFIIIAFVLFLIFLTEKILSYGILSKNE